MSRFATAAVAVGALAVADAGPPWASRADIPSACEPRVLVPDNGRCLFSYQCESDYCCPYYKSCFSDVLQYTAVNDMGDTLRMEMVWGLKNGVANEGTRGNFNGTQLRTTSPPYPATDICNRDQAALDAQEVGRCTMYEMNGDPPTIALVDKAPFVKAYDLTNAECQCDSRFTDLYLSKSWTGTFHDGAFRNYCDYTAWDYIPSDAGADNCPTGWERIVDLTECKTAIGYLGMVDDTNYFNGTLGTDTRPGCAVNTLNNKVVFNADRTDTNDFKLTATEKYICKPGAGTTVTQTMVGSGDSAGTSTTMSGAGGGEASTTDNGNGASTSSTLGRGSTASTAAAAAPGVAALLLAAAGGLAL